LAAQPRCVINHGHSTATLGSGAGGRHARRTAADDYNLKFKRSAIQRWFGLIAARGLRSEIGDRVEFHSSDLRPLTSDL